MPGPLSSRPMSPSGAAILLSLIQAPRAVTGTLTETVLASSKIPAGMIGKNGIVEIYAMFDSTNSANNKTYKARFGGQTVYTVSVTTSSYGVVIHKFVLNMNSLAAQNMGGTGMNGASGTSALLPSLTVDTGAADITVDVTGTLTNTGETITCKGFFVRVHPRA